MSGNPLVRFDEGRVGRTLVSPSLLLYRETWVFAQLSYLRSRGGLQRGWRAGLGRGQLPFQQRLGATGQCGTGRFRTDQLEHGPSALQGLFVEELGAARRDGGGGAGHLLVVGQVEGVLAQMLLGQLVRAGVKVLRQLADGAA